MSLQVEAMYNQGRIEFVEPLRLKHNHVRLVVTVPDEEVEPQINPYSLPPELFAQSEAMLEKYEAILHAPLPPDEEPAEISAKQLERIAAFELRAQMRFEQGRPV